MISVEKSNKNATVTLNNDLVAAMADDLREKLKQLMQGGVTQLTIDMKQVEMIDSIGIGLLIAAHNSMPKPEGRLRLCNLNADLLGLFQTMRLDKHFHILDE